jgi:hypothetical protein
VAEQKQHFKQQHKQPCSFGLAAAVRTGPAAFAVAARAACPPVLDAYNVAILF